MHGKKAFCSTKAKVIFWGGDISDQPEIEAQAKSQQQNTGEIEAHEISI